MQERHDNDKIEPHNHNEYPLLYKEAELLMSVLGRFLECRKWNILVITWALGIFLIYMPAPSGLRPSDLGIYIRQIPLAHGITITYIYIFLLFYFYMLTLSCCILCDSLFLVTLLGLFVDSTKATTLALNYCLKAVYTI